MATKEAAAVANNYGVSIEQLTALVTMATARTRQSGSETGTAVRSLMLNLNDITNKQIVKAFNYVGVSMYKMVEGSKQLKTPIELLGELSEVFNSLPKGDDRRAYILSEIGGKYRSNTLAAILQDWDSMQGIMETYERGAGSAMEEAQKTVNTLASSLTNLRTSGQEFFSKFFDTDKVTGFLKAFTQLVQLTTDLVDTLGAIPTILGTIGATALIKNGGIEKLFTLFSGSMVSGNVAASPYIQNTTGGFSYVTQALNSFKNVIGGTQEQVESFYSALEQEGAGALANYIRTTDQAKLSVQGFYNSLNLQTSGFSNVRNVIAQYNSITDTTGQTQAAFANSVKQTNIGLASYISSVNAGKASMGGYMRSLVATAAKSAVLKVATIALNTAISMGVMFLISKGIQAISDWANAEHDAAVAAKESAEETKQNVDASEEYAQKVIELRERLEEGNLSYTETVETRKELIDLQDKLNKFYGDEINNVNTLKDSYDKLNESQRDFVSQEANKWISDNADSIEKAQTAYEHFGNVDYFDTLANDIQKLKNGTTSIEEYNEIVSRYEKELASNSSKFKKWNGEYADNLQDVLAQQENLAHDLQEYIYDRATDPNWIEKLGNIYTTYGGSQKKQYGFNYGNSQELLEIYNQYGEMLAKSKYDDILAQITAQQNKLNEALANEDTEGIKQAREELEKLSKTVQDYQVIVSEDNAARLYLSNLIGDSFSEDELQKSLKEAYNNAFANLYNTYANGEWTHDQKLTRDITAGIRDLSIDELTTLSNVNISQIKAYGKDVNEAIDKALQEEKTPFNWADFYEEQGLEDIEKRLKTLKTAYKSLAEDGDLNNDDKAGLIKEYPELLQYIDDPERLKVAIQSSAREALSASQLVLSNLYLAAEAGSTEEQNLKKALQVIDDMADVTTKVKEKTTKTSDLYKEQKKQIHENIQALNREIQSIDKQVDALEKKKEAQEEYVKQLEEEKDRLDDLIDKYERAADTVSDYIDEQIDGLEKQQDAIEKSYNDQIDALKEYYEEQSDLLSEQIKGLEFDSSSYDSQID